LERSEGKGFGKLAHVSHMNEPRHT